MPRQPRAIDPRLVDQHFRVVLPKGIVDALGLNPGSHVHFALALDGRVELRKVRLTLE